MGKMLRAIAWTSSLAVIAMALACSTKPSSSSPNSTPGQCVLQDHLWYCGGAYGNIPACQGNESCDNDAAPCFKCDLGAVAGDVYSCQHDQDGGRTWEGIPSETGCSCPSYKDNPGCN